MGQNLFNVLFSTIKTKFAAIVSRIRLWTSWNFIRVKIIGSIRDFFYKVLDIKPKDKNDYYTVFGWMISKRLAYAVIIIIGVLSIWYITATTRIFSSFGENGVRTYKYNSVLLRLAEGSVRIKGKSGYLAYEGQVSKGYVTGDGTLYSPDKLPVYKGGFEKNLYEGAGISYFDSGAMRYSGAFHKNLYEGNGTLYREDGTREYTGGFMAGHKEGDGQLFGKGDELIYEGSFSSDSIVYSEFLGKSAPEIRDKYFGGQVMYEDASEEGAVAMHLPDINALYYAKSNGSAADNTVKIDSILVLTDTFRLGELEANEASELEEIFGSPVYEGNSYITFPEAVAINIRSSGDVATVKSRVGWDIDVVYSDDIIVEDYDKEYSVYVYTFKRGSLAYTFVCKGRGEGFYFYEITGNSEGEDF